MDASVKIRTGRYEDCKNICFLNYWDCDYFVFFTDKFPENMTHLCIMFEDRLDITIHMPGVISGKEESIHLLFLRAGYSQLLVNLIDAILLSCIRSRSRRIYII